MGRKGGCRYGSIHAGFQKQENAENGLRATRPGRGELFHIRRDLRGRKVPRWRRPLASEAGGDRKDPRL
jgi:hypothetical protein